MAETHAHALGRRAFLAGGGLLIGCARATFETAPRASSSGADAAPTDAGTAPSDAGGDGGRAVSTYALFDAFPALRASLPRIELGQFPSVIEPSRALLEEGRLWIKRDDDFTRSASWQSTFDLARTYGGGKVRKLELYFGQARAQGKQRIVTLGGVGSNQALAAALLGQALGFSVGLYLAPQAKSSLTSKNLAADAASHAEMRLFDSVLQAQAEAEREAAQRSDTYVISPGGTTPLGTLGFVSAALELAGDVRAGRMPAPRRIYVALGLGGSAAGLGLGCAASGLQTEIVAVRTSNPNTVSESRLRAIHDETVAFARARDPAFPAVKFADAKVRIDGRFVGPGYGVPTPAGEDAVARARKAEGWELDPVYTGKALAALLADAQAGAPGPMLFWNTASSRPVATAAVSAPFQRYL
jgi:1-aminocyclopropane-1-carboxylate deaminase/D-cysteine desulfhydrase-like pyridoxal-dependent ACC family enzyme